MGAVQLFKGDRQHGPVRRGELRLSRAEKRPAIRIAGDGDGASEVSAQLQRQVASLQKRLDAFQGGGSSSAPTHDLSEVFLDEPLPGGDDAAPVVGAGPRTYRVKRGDTLWKIAQRAYGDASRNVDIRNANPDKIGPDDRLSEGTVLVLP